MYFTSTMYMLFCVLCVLVPVWPKTHYPPQQPGGPQDGLPGAPNDDPGHVPDNSPLPDQRVPHSFNKRVVEKNSGGNGSTISDKKVFVTLKIQGIFTYKKRKVKGNRVTFTCNGCQKLKKCISVMAWIEHVDNDDENDVYTLDVDSLPPVNDHICVPSGIEDLVINFRAELESSARAEPTQPFPTLYQIVRRRFTSGLSYDLKLLFLAQIPSTF